MDELRIPKIAVPIVIHSDQDQTEQGEIFLEQIQVEGYSTGQVAEYFNSTEPFFPLRTKTQSILVRKQSVNWIEFPELYERYQKEVSSSFDVRKKATLHIRNADPIRVRVIVNMPEDHARVLDILNTGGAFIPVLIQEIFALFNSRVIDRVEEP